MASVSGDPRRPAEVHSFIREPVDISHDPPDYYSGLSMLLGFLSFTLKWKALAWACFICCGASFGNMRNLDSDVKQLSMSIMFATMSLVSAYTGDESTTVTVPLSSGTASLDAGN
uniref:Protein Asterix n=1 Tax=Globisporangium ultimum (strain ATCC 200006 / CBS 805.95 / DAOM BR144) TaxID=431595 RepID=K3X4B9_GLOUD